MISWHCKTCGWATAEAQEAFRHRSVEESPAHTIRPLTREEAESLGLAVPFDSRCGIDRHFAMEEI